MLPLNCFNPRHSVTKQKQELMRQNERDINPSFSVVTLEFQAFLLRALKVGLHVVVPQLKKVVRDAHVQEAEGFVDHVAFVLAAVNLTVHNIQVVVLRLTADEQECVDPVTNLVNVQEVTADNKHGCSYKLDIGISFTTRYIL